MFNKKVLSMAVACAATGISVSALAAFNVTTGGGEIAIASESVTPTTTGVLQVGVGNTTGALNVNGQIQVGVPANDQIYIRYDWTGGELLADLSGTIVTVGTVGSTSLTGGLDGDNSAVFGVLAGAAGFSQTASVALAFGTDGIGLLQGQNLSVRQRVYTDQGDAIAGAAGLSDQTADNVVTLSAALSVDFDAETATADVETNFTAFTGGNTSVGTLGVFTPQFATGLSLASDLTSVTGLAQLVNLAATTAGSQVVYSGNFGFATGGFFISGLTTGSCGTVGAGTPLSPTSASNFTETSIDVASAQGRALCVSVNGEQTIPEVTTFDAAVTLLHANTSSNPSSTSDTDSVGEIDRNGTTVEVAYVTTFEDYNQRLILNSRSATVAEYFITFQTEDGVTHMALPAAEGTLQPNEVLVLRMEDLVEFTGGSRGTATVTVVAPDTDIDVATTQVLRGDGATDTVYWSVK